RYAFIGAEGKGAVNDARGGVAAESIFLGFTADGFAVGAHQFELCLQGSARAVALDLIELAEDGSPLGQSLTRVKYAIGGLRCLGGFPLAPEIDSVNVAVRVKQGPMVRVVVALAGNVRAHGK